MRYTMSDKLNCWEYHDCGRQKDGMFATQLGECPVSTAMKYDGLNEGHGAGRACWMVMDSACQRDARSKGRSNPCHQCSFYRRVLFEEEEKVVFAYSSFAV